MIVTDDTAAINAAISAGSRCSSGICKGSTISPATVYIPSGYVKIPRLVLILLTGVEHTSSASPSRICTTHRSSETQPTAQFSKRLRLSPKKALELLMQTHIFGMEPSHGTRQMCSFGRSGTWSLIPQQSLRMFLLLAFTGLHLRPQPSQTVFSSFPE